VPILTTHVAYVSDDGNTYQRRTFSDLVTPLGLASEAVGAHPYLPRRIRPRYILARDPGTGREHKLRGVSATHAAFVGTQQTITVPDPANRQATGAGMLTLNVAGRMGERRFQP
jgi:hypothetical protein